MTYAELLPLLRWRRETLKGPISAEAMADSLSSENLRPVDTLEWVFHRQIVAFRKRNQVYRIALCKRFLSEEQQPGSFRMAAKRKTCMKRKPSTKPVQLNWEYNECGQHCHEVRVGGRYFSAFLNLRDNKVYFAEGNVDPRYNGKPCKDFEEATALAVEILKKDKAELEALGI